ncbi:MAG TPA: PaaI family thioesterase [Microthrixaceae bacterium]|nr:PaaI family thioesterase [Microthrixaceae bacterium]
MNLDETPEELEARARMATSLQRLGHSLVGHRVDADLAGRIADLAAAATEEVSARPARDRTAEIATSPRFARWLGGDALEPIGLDGEPMDLFRDSVVSGRTNPMGIGLEVRRHGDSVVATTALGPAFEGAPGRAHGGVVAAIVDETIGYVLPILGELAYTANLNLDYVAPAPLHQELRVTASLRDRADRKLWLQAHGESDDGIFVRAEALFLTVDLTKFANDDSTT